MPEKLSLPHLAPLQSYVIHLLTSLLSLQAFHILPNSSFRAQNPTELPRERFVEDAADAVSDATVVKKKGRPSKRDKARKAKDAVAALDRWLEKNTYTYPDASSAPESSVATVTSTAPLKTTHTLISHPPTGSRAIYSMEKTRLLHSIDPPNGNSFTVPNNGNVASGACTDGSRQPVLSVNLVDPVKRQLIADSHGPLERKALERANEVMLARLKRIDEMAAERGLEVGGEGGDKTGLSRVERAVQELKDGKIGSRGGILSLLEGAGLAEGGRETKQENAE